MLWNSSRDLVRLLLFVALLVVAPRAVFAQVTEPGGLTPEKLVSLFDQWAMVVMAVVGVIWTRWPRLKDWTNDAVPWVNAVAYILAAIGSKLAVADAHAGVGDAIGGFAGLLWTAAKGGAMSAVTSLLYDKFAKAILDKYLPKPA